MYRLISLAFVMSCTSAANAQLHIKPQTPTPTPLIREAFMPKGDVLLSYPKDDILDEKPIWHWGYHQRKLNELEITNALGEKLTEKEIRKTLEKPTIVLISADGKPVHPYYLKVIRPDTLVIIDKTPKREAPDREPVKQRTLKVDPEKRETPKKNLGGLRVSETNAVYAKVILAVKALDDGDQPLLESWIAKELRKRGATDLRAVTDWVRLTDGGESTSVWEAKLDGQLSGCPVDAQVGERTADGKVQVTLSGWSPFGANVRGNTLPDEIGSRGIAIVDPGRADEVESYVALMIAPALQTNAAGERDGARQPVNAPESKTEDKQKPKPESERRSPASLPKDYSDVEKKHPEFKAATDQKTGFVVGGKNSSELIRNLTEINGISIPDLEESMRPKGLSTAGFLGKDERLLDVMAADNDWVLGVGLTHQELARHLYTFYRISLAAAEPPEESEVFTYRGVRFTTVVQTMDGFQDSPFKDGTKTNSDVFLKNVDNGKTLAFSPLVPLMVERYGFYEGHGTSYRVDPKDIVDVLTFLSVEKNGEQDTQANLRPLRTRSLRVKRNLKLHRSRASREVHICCTRHSMRKTLVGISTTTSMFEQKVNSSL